MKVRPVICALKLLRAFCVYVLAQFQSSRTHSFSLFLSLLYKKKDRRYIYLAAVSISTLAFPCGSAGIPESCKIEALQTTRLTLQLVNISQNLIIALCGTSLFINLISSSGFHTKTKTETETKNILF